MSFKVHIFPVIPFMASQAKMTNSCHALLILTLPSTFGTSPVGTFQPATFYLTRTEGKIPYEGVNL